MRLLSSVRLPTRVDDWKLVARTVRLVLSLPTYAVLAFLYGVLALTVFVFARNLTVLRRVILFGELPVDSRLQVLVGMYPGFGAAYTPGQTAVLVATGALVGLDLAMLTYHFRAHGASLRDGSGGVTGVLLGTLGGGCAACGSAVVAGVLSMVGASGLLAVLPLDGLEFALLALGLLLASIYWLAEGMRGREIAGCPVGFASDAGD